MIPLDEQVIICAKHKKCVTEVETFQKDNNEILVSTLWRNGEFGITCTSLKEARFLQEMFKSKDREEVCLTDAFEEMEMLGTFDGISTDFLGDCEELEDALVDEDVSYWEWLEENGWEHINTQYYVYGAVEYVKAD